MTRRRPRRLSRGTIEWRNDSVLRHSKLVHNIAKRYRNPDVDYHSLVQEGHIGLLKASRTYKPKKGTFSTHATPWIRKQVQQAVRAGLSVRLPEKRLKTASRPQTVPLLHDWMRREEGGMRRTPARTVIESSR